MQPTNQKSSQFEKINTDEYVDIALKGVLNLYPQLATKIIEKDISDINWDGLERLYTIMTNQAESTLRACQFISETKRRFDFLDLKPEEQALLLAAETYLKTVPRFVDANKLTITNQARRILVDFLNESYATKIQLRVSELENEINNEPDENKKTRLKETKNSKIDMYRVELMLNAVNRERGEDVEMDA